MSDETVEQGALEPMPPVAAAVAEPKQGRSWVLPVGIGVAGVVLASLTGAAGFALGSERGERGEAATMMAESGDQRMQGPGAMQGPSHDEGFGERDGHGPGHGGGREGGMHGGHMGGHHGGFDMDGGFGPGQGMAAPGA